MSLLPFPPDDVHARHAYGSDGINLWLTRRHHSRDTGPRTEVVVFQPGSRTHDEGESIEPTLFLPREVARKLMNALWDAGLRPSSPSPEQQAGELAATKVHLSDMRAIAFAKLEVDKP